MPAPTIFLIAGCNGAGKTTFAKEFLPSIGVIRFLNADEIARGLSPLKPEAVAFKAGKLLLSELRELVDRQQTFALESTLSGKTYVRIFEKAKQCGYAIELHFVWIPDVREAIRRVRQRVIEGGHNVPVEDIRRRFARSIQHLLDDYAPIADRWVLWDNSTPPAKPLANSVGQTIVDLRTFFAAR
ncbi:MAG TPA: zeta toxin family protein [Chthoniobacterales bacterium]|nr:zeta toxin family protein [Chthoniobacterales bacterium]